LTAPESGRFQLGLVVDSGGKLYLDDSLLVEAWNEWNAEPAMTEITLEKDRQYALKIELLEKRGEAVAYFIWETPGGKKRKETGAAFEVAHSVVDQVKKADVAIFVAGLDAKWEGEELSSRVGIDGFYKGDRTTIELPAIQMQTIQALQKTGTPIILVLMAGSAVAFDGMDKDLPAILEAWYPGQRGGDAVVDALFGDINPAGRLPVTFYQSTEDLPDFRDYNMKAKNGFTYRYFKGEPLYPFGHGLSYTRFEYSDLKIDKTRIGEKDDIQISVQVKNTGDYDGDEVVQVYAKDLESDQVMPVKQLREFKRISLKKGEQKTIDFTLNAAEDMRYYDAFHKQYMVEPGGFEIQVGASSRDIRLKKTITVE
jgi:beta-glucosidase